MHVPEHLVSTPVEIAAGAGAIAALALVAARPTERSSRPATLVDRPDAPSASAATAALVFALQMVNVPVLPGTSGHLLGGALAVALLGARRAAFAVSAVVVVQAVLFADGGIGAIGVNVWLIALLPVALAAAAMELVAGDGRSVPATSARWWVAVCLGAAAAPVVSATVLGAVVGLDGAGPSVATGEILASMVRVHLAIAVLEVVVTAVVIAATVLGTRIVRSCGSTAGAGRSPVTTRVPDQVGVVGVVAMAVATMLSLLASSAPDGLERVTGDLALAIDGRGSLLDSMPLADYGVAGMGGPASLALAGAIGVIATALATAGLVAVVRPVEHDTD